MRELFVAAIGAALTFAGGRAEPDLRSAQSLPDSVCYEGSIGTGPRLRRVVVEARLPAAATVHLYARPTRVLTLSASSGESRLSSPDRSTAVELDTGTGAPTAKFTTVLGRDTVRSLLRRIGGTPGAAAVAGEWTAAIGPGGVIRLVSRLATGPCGLIVGAFDSPDQGQRDLPITAARVAGDSVVIAAEYMDLRIAVPLRGTDERPAMMTQHGVTSEIIMRRGAGSSPRRPQEPVRPFPYLEQDARFPSRSAGIRLAGTLTLPSAPGPHPAIVLISGSGAQDRDETVAGHRPFLVLADHLTRRGYAVLRVDDRGVGGSSGNVLKSGLHDLADDVRGAVDYLRARDDIDGSGIGLFGHSEGGYVAPIVASSDPAIAFVGVLVGPAVKGREVLVAQRASMGRASGSPPLEIRVDSLFIARIFSVLDTRPDDARLGVAVDSAYREWVLGLPASERAAVEKLVAGRTATQDSTSLELWKSGWFKSLYHHDPSPHLRALSVPVLALLGDLDLQVPAAQSGPAFEAAYAGARRSLLTLHRLPGINHMLQRATTGRMEEYMQIEETIAPEVVARIDEWLARVAPTRRRR